MKVDIYLLSSAETRQQLLFTAQLSSKIMGLGHKLIIQIKDHDQLKQLDELMWTYSQNSFLPHAVLGKDEIADPQTPIWICSEIKQRGDFKVLINLGDEATNSADPFERLAEVVVNQPDALEQARARYRYYQSQHYQIDTHSI